MNTYVQNMIGVFAGIWSRIIGFSDTPSLLVVALIVNLVTVLPTAFRVQKENTASRVQETASVQNASALISSD